MCGTLKQYQKWHACSSLGQNMQLHDVHAAMHILYAHSAHIPCKAVEIATHCETWHGMSWLYTTKSLLFYTYSMRFPSVLISCETFM